MSENGILRDKNDVKLLILYILKSFESPLERSALNDIIMGEGAAEYFGVSDCVSELIRSGHLSESGGCLALASPEAVEMLTQFEKKLPFSTRKRIAAAIARLKLKFKAESEIMCAVTAAEGGYRATCSVLENGDEIMAFSVRLPAQMQAELVCRRFRENAAEIYGRMMDLLLGGALSEAAHTPGAEP